jgi:hypothetical protein
MSNLGCAKNRWARRKVWEKRQLPKLRQSALRRPRRDQSPPGTFSKEEIEAAIRRALLDRSIRRDDDRYRDLP